MVVTADRSARVRVLQVIDHLHVGGAQAVLRGISMLADRSRFQLSVANVMRGYDPDLVGALRASCREVLLLEGRGMWDLRAVASLVRAIRRSRIDVVHTHLAIGDFCGGLAGRLTGRPVVATLHSVAGDRRTHPLPRRTLARFATRSLADELIAVSEAVKTSHVEELGIASARLRVLRNVSLAGLLLPPDFDRRRKRAELRLGDEPVAAAVARLAAPKDHDTLLRALPSVLAECPTLRVLIVGDGPRRDELERLARELAVGHAVRFLGQRADAVEIVAATDVICSPTLENEGLSITVLDAMKLGIPVLATRVSSLEEVIADGRSGLLVPPRDSRAFAAALLMLLRDADTRRRIGAAARVEAGAQLDPGRWIREHEAIYARLAAHGRSRGGRGER